jgi:hypothetical protein
MIGNTVFGTVIYSVYWNHSKTSPKFDIEVGGIGLAYTIEIRLYTKGTYILADIHGMDHFRTKLAPQPYNNLESCVSKIHKPMVMVWFGNV